MKQISKRHIDVKYIQLARTYHRRLTISKEIMNFFPMHLSNPQSKRCKQADKSEFLNPSNFFWTSTDKYFKEFNDCKSLKVSEEKREQTFSLAVNLKLLLNFPI